MSLENWVRVLGFVTVGSTALAAGAGSLLWYFSDRLSDRKDAALAQFQQESKTATAAADARAAEANAVAAGANLKAKEAGEGTARALAEVAAARERETALTLRVEEQREKTARAEERAAKAEERAAGVGRAVGEVQEQISPRHLPLADQKIAALVGIWHIEGREEINLFIPAGEPEILYFGQDMAGILELAGWSVNVFLGTDSTRTVTAGVLVEVKSDADHRLRMAARGIQGSLVAREFNAVLQVSDRQFAAVGTGAHNPNAKITITLAKKPPYPHPFDWR